MTSTSAAANETALASVQKVYDAFARRDIASVLSAFSPDIEIVQSKELPWGGEYVGHDGARDFFRRLTQHLNSTVAIERLISAGNHVVAVGRTSGTANGTGSPYNVPIVHVWTVSCGLVARAEFYIDHPAMLPALQDGNHE